MAMSAQDIAQLIQEGIPDAQVTIHDLSGNGNHYAAHVTAESFRGKGRIEQHRMVHDALKNSLNGPLHALALHTKVPEKNKAKRGS